VRRADNPTTFMCRLSWNLGTSTSWNPQGLSRPVMGLLYLYLYLYFSCNNVGNVRNESVSEKVALVCNLIFSPTFARNISHSKKTSSRCFHKCT